MNLTLLYHICIFIFSSLVLFWAGNSLISSLIRIAKSLQWREFVVAFFVIAFASSLPNLFVGINSALSGIPELSFGDVVGGNVINLTIVVVLSVLVAGSSIPAESRTVQTTTIFTSAIAILPLLLIWDGILGRGDGLILLSIFFLYIFWLFSKEERFRKVYDGQTDLHKAGLRWVLKDFVKLILAVILLLLASKGIVSSATYFASILNLSLGMVGIMIIAFGNALPEAYFSVISAMRKETWMILGNLMGSVIVTATLILGIVALIHPIEIQDFSPFAIARFFLIISALLFFWIVKTGRKITQKEAIILLAIYIAFIIAEVGLKP